MNRIILIICFVIIIIGCTARHSYQYQDVIKTSINKNSNTLYSYDQYIIIKTNNDIYQNNQLINIETIGPAFLISTNAVKSYIDYNNASAMLMLSFSLTFLPFGSFGGYYILGGGLSYNIDSVLLGLGIVTVGIIAGVLVTIPFINAMNSHLEKAIYHYNLKLKEIYNISETINDRNKIYIQYNCICINY